MTVEEAIRARILSLPAVTAIAGTRGYLHKLPQGPTYPCWRVQLVDDPQTQHLRGPNGVRRARVQVDAYARDGAGDTYGQVAALARAIDGNGLGTYATGVFGWIGRVGTPPVEIRNVWHASGRLGPRYDAEELRVLTMTQDYYVSYRPPGMSSLLTVQLAWPTLVAGDPASVIFGWHVVTGAESYVLEVGTATGLSDVGVFATTETSYALTLAAGTYYARVRAVVDGVPGDPSDEQTFTV